LGEFASRLLSPADPLALLPQSLLRRLFIGAPPLQFAEEPFALKLAFQSSQGLFDIVVANENFQGGLLSERSVCAYLLP
jgi:hypothetical protein